MACIFQLLIEFLFYETTECLMMNFFIPELVRNEIQSVIFILKQTMTISNSTQHWILDTPMYFFTST